MTQPANQKYAVMYVEDDPDDQEIFKHILNEVNPHLDCVIANDGIEALDTLAKIQQPLCIYIDINMPKMNGIQLLKILRSNPKYSKIPTFILSTSTNPKDLNAAKSYDALYFTKPDHLEDYKRLLHECFVQHSKGGES